jgi:hypothetical protein
VSVLLEWLPQKVCADAAKFGVAGVGNVTDPEVGAVGYGVSELAQVVVRAVYSGEEDAGSGHYFAVLCRHGSSVGKSSRGVAVSREAEEHSANAELRELG